ncbi:MAG: toll/interleukin-1 receptor domain-containing protein, partial [Planctomycetia bacterium]|nr:toll/interleukin-1 receptor domain-containing protein [Planctomycetia bacterium]
MATVFISYCSHDKDFANRLADDLRRAGHQPWIDYEQIVVGNSVTGTVSKGLRQCRFLALVLTPESVASPWCSNEWMAKFSAQ